MPGQFLNFKYRNEIYTEIYEDAEQIGKFKLF